jgi:hypothetical protein
MTSQTFDMASMPLAHGKARKKKLAHIEIHKHDGDQKGHIAIHKHHPPHQMQEHDEQHFVPKGQMDEHLEENPMQEPSGSY